MAGPGKSETEGISFFLTKADTDHVNRKETYRVCDISGNDAAPYELLADGAYCGYFNENKGWLYPCKVDDAGCALDSVGNAIDWDDPDWFGHSVHDSEYGLRMTPLDKDKPEAKATLVICSPARRMHRFPDDVARKDQRWGFHVRYDEDFHVSEPIDIPAFSYTFLQGNYVYDCSADTLRDLRAKVNVVIACGMLSASELHSVRFQNVMTEAWYRPKAKLYECPVKDEGKSEPSEAYTLNSFPDAAGSSTGSGNMLLVPEGEDDIRLVRQAGITEYLNSNDKKWPDSGFHFTEWRKGSADATAVTAIRSFPLFAYEYAARDGDKWIYEDEIPEIIVEHGSGQVRSTVLLAADLKPMTEYTVMIYLSNAYISADLHAGAWDDMGPLSVGYNECLELPVVTENMIGPWIENPDIDEDEGKIVTP